MAREFLRLLKTALAGWWNDRALSLGAALSFYTIFSMAPVLLMAVSIAGIAFGQEAARGAIVDEIGGLIGHEPAKAIQSMLASAGQFGSGTLNFAIGIVMFIILATGAIVELQDDLHQIFKVEPQSSAFTELLRSRLLSLGLVVSVGFLLLVSLAINAGLTALTGYVSNVLPGAEPVIYIVNFLISFAAAAVLFALVFKVLPEAHIPWRDVTAGALLTSALFQLGKFLIGFYIGQSGLTTTYGAAASLVTILLWVYYSSQIMLFGAEFTKAYGDRRRRRHVGAPQEEDIPPP